jgi:glucosamine--fructose-6-phosphate aminotransferase (isomerizing)
MSGMLMAAEMAEQPSVLENGLARFDEHVAAVAAIRPPRLAGVQFLARGSSDHAAVFGRYLVELVGGRPAGLVAPSVHTRYGAQVDYRNHLVVALSQSGATPEIVTVLERLRAAGAATVAVVNDPDGPLAGVADAVLALGAGVERAVPATKTVTADLLALVAVAAALGSLPFDRTALAALPEAVATVLADPAPAQDLAMRWSWADRIVLSGRGLLTAAALEGALKLKETTGAWAEGLSGADLLHGPIGAVGPDVPVLVFDDGGPLAADARALVRRLAEAGAPVARCSPDGGVELSLPGEVPWALAAIPAVVRGQQLAHALASARGRNADAPPGLTKVTPTR